MTSPSPFLSCPLIIKVILGTFPQIMGFTDSELQFYQMASVSFWQNGSMISWTESLIERLQKCSTSRQMHRTKKVNLELRAEETDRRGELQLR